jgi:hypothetical protein
LETLSQGQPKKNRLGRPRLPKGEAKGRIVPVRFDSEDLRLVTTAAKAEKRGLSDWIRKTLRTAAEDKLFQRTLHDAMKIVLSSRPDRAATTTEISKAIEIERLYTRKDGESPKANQISARARKYPLLFCVDGGRIRLIDPSNSDSK